MCDQTDRKETYASLQEDNFHSLIPHQTNKHNEDSDFGKEPASKIMKKDQAEEIQFEDLPNEIILEIVKHLELEDIAIFGHISRRFRTLAHHESIWKKVNLLYKNTTKDFIQFIVMKGSINLL